MRAELNPKLWWYIARASGFAAWGLSIAAIVLGLALATRALGNRPRPAWLLDLHRYVGGLTVAFIGLHLAGLVGDNYLHFGRADLLVPFASQWKPGPVAWGIVGMWLLLAVEVSSLAMRRLPRRAWHAIHLTSYLAAALSTIHAFTAGTDARSPALTWITIGSLAGIAFFFVYRALLPKRKRRAMASARARTPATAARSGRPAAARTTKADTEGEEERKTMSPT